MKIFVRRMRGHPQPQHLVTLLLAGNEDMRMKVQKSPERIKKIKLELRIVDNKVQHFLTEFRTRSKIAKFGTRSKRFATLILSSLKVDEIYLNSLLYFGIMT